MYQRQRIAQLASVWVSDVEVGWAGESEGIINESIN